MGLNVAVTIKKSGLDRLCKFAHGKLTDPDKEELADILDETFDFGTSLFGLLELGDEPLFKFLIDKGIDAIPDEVPDVPPPNPT